MSSDEIFFDGIPHISAAAAAQESNLTRDYIARLCKQGKISARRSGKVWYIEHEALKSFLTEHKHALDKWRQTLAEQRSQDYQGSVSIADTFFAKARAHARKVQAQKDLPKDPAGVSYITATDAARETNLTRDYIARLCREGKIKAKQIDKVWYVNQSSLQIFSLEHKFALNKWREALAAQRSKEYYAKFANPSSSTAKAGAVRRTLFASGGLSQALSSPAVSSSLISPASNVPAGLSDAILQAAHISPSMVTPALETFHKLVSFALALTLTVGTYAVVNPASARDAVRFITHSSQNADHLTGVEAPTSALKNAGVAAVANSVVPSPRSSASWTEKISQALHSGMKALADVVLFPVRFFADMGQNPDHGSITAVVGPGDISLGISSRTAPTPAPQIITNNTYNTYNTTNNKGGNTYNTYTAADGAVAGGVSENEFQAKMKALSDSLRIQTSPSSVPSSGGVANSITLMQNIDNLNGTHLTNVSVNGVSGLTANDIPALQYISMSGGTLTGALNSTYTGTSTFSGSLSMGGNVAVGSTTSSAKLAVGAKESDTSSLLFEISSSTDSLFSVDNSGLTTFVNAIGNAATTTTFFSTTSSSTNSYSASAYFGNANIVTLTAGSTTLANLFATSANITGNVGIGGDLTLTSTSSIFSATNVVFTNATTTNATSTNFYASVLGAVTASTTDLTATNFSASYATTTTLFSTTASSTNLFAQSGTIGALTANTLTVNGITTYTGLTTFTNGFLSNASSTITSGLFSMNGGASTTNLTASGTGYFGTATSTTSNANTANFGALNVTGLSTLGTLSLTSGTSTNFFSTTASSTNLFSQSGTIGALTANTLTLNSTFTSTGLATFTNGFISNASSTITTGLFSMNGGASTTNLTVSGYAILGNATTTNLFSTTASSTNLFAQTTQLGSLTVLGGTTLNSALTYGGVTLSNAVTGTGNMVLSSSPTLSNPRISIAIGGSTSSGSIELRSTSGTGTTDAITFTGGTNGATEIARFQNTSGVFNFGIGTSTPYSKLTTWGTSSLFEAVTNASTTVFSIGQGGATSTAFFATTASSTNLFAQSANFGTLTVNGLSTLGTLSLTAGTTTNFFSTVASSTNLFSQSGTIGTLSLNTALPITSGGTGLASYTANRIIYTDAAGTAFAQVATSSLNIGGNAGTATILQTARNINGTSFNGSADITITAASSTLLANNNTYTGLNSFSNASTTLLTISGSSWLGTPLALVGTNITGTGASFTAGAATVLATARNINGTSFNGSADITITAASSTLLANNNTYTGLNSFSNATSTLFTSTTAWIDTLNLTNDLTVANGGTGASTLTGLLQGNGTSAITGITGTAGQFPYYNGTNTLLATSSIFLATSGNVGIGTTTPQSLLTVQTTGNAFAFDRPGVVGGTINGNNGAFSMVSSAFFEWYTGGTDYAPVATNSEMALRSHILTVGTSTPTTGGHLNIWGKNGANSYLMVTNVDTANNGTTPNGDVFIINGTGNVGIGTTSPYAMLSVAGQIVGTYFTATSTTDTNTFPILSITNGTSTNFFSTTASSTNLFSQSGTIGALTANTLTLNSTFTSTGLATFTNGFLSLASSTITSGLFSMNGGASTTNITASGTGYFGLGQFTNTSGTTTIATGQGFTIGSSQFVLQQTSGNVGIGTTAPLARLHIAGTYTTPNAYLMRNNATLRSTVTGNQFSFANDNFFDLSDAPSTVTSLYGYYFNPAISAGSVNVSNFYANAGQLQINAAYTGAVGEGRTFNAADAVNGTSIPMLSFSQFYSSATANGTGTTTGPTINNYGFRSIAHTAAAGYGGTINNYGVNIVPPTGSGEGVTTNYGLRITGDGGTVTDTASTTNWSMYVDSQAPAYFESTISIGDTGKIYPSGLWVATSSVSTSNSQIGVRSKRAAIVSGNLIGGLDFYSDDTNLTAPGTRVASIQTVANTTHTASALGTDITFNSTTGTTYAELMRLTGAGNLGIGTTSPESLLDVDGKGTFGTEGASTAQLLVKGGASGGAMITLSRTNGTTRAFSWALTGGGLSFTDDTAGFTAANIFGSAGLDEIYAGQKAKASAGTRDSLFGGTTIGTAAGSDLSVGNLILQGNLGTGAGTPGDILLKTGTILGTGTTEQSGATRMTIKNDTGNVGIGTTTPYSKLTTWGTGSLFEAVTSASTTVFSIGQGGATSTAFFATTASSTNLFAQSAELGSLTVLGGTTLNSALTYGGVTLSNAVTGTGNMVLSAGATLTGNTNAALIRGGTGNGAGLALEGTSSATPNASATLSLGASIPGAPDAAGTFTTTGFGIGTTTPWGKFAISGNTSDADVTNPLFTIASSTATATSTLFTVLRSGNVGIGTTSPSQALSVLGKVYTTGGIQFSDGSLQTAAAAGGAVGTQGQAGYYATGGSTLSGTSTLFFATNQNIGVGTTTPYSKLTMWGTGSLFEAVTNASTTVFSIGQGGATSTAFFATTASSTNLFSANATFGALTVTGQTTLATSLSGLLQGASGVVSAISGTAGQFPYYNGTNTLLATSTLFVSTASNIGIGTTDPSTKLYLIASTTLHANYLDTPHAAFGEYQNFLLQTEALATTWVANNLSSAVTSNTAVDPRGTVLAEIIPAGNDATGYLAQTITNSTTDNWTFSVYLRAQSGTATAQLRIDVGNGTATTTGTAKTVNLTTEWERYSVTENVSAAHTLKTVFIVNGTAAIAAFDTQLEQGSYARRASPPITTAAVTAVTRTAYIPSAVTILGALAGATTGAFSGAITSTVPTLYVSTSANILTAAVSTGVTSTLVPLSLSPRLLQVGQAWDVDGGANTLENWWQEVTPYVGNTVNSKLAWYHAQGALATANEYQAPEIMNYYNSSLNVLGSTYGTESFTNGALTSGTSWGVTGDFALTANTAKFTGSTLTGTLTQTSANFAIPVKANRWYRFTWTSSALNTTARAYIDPTGISAEKVYLRGISVTAGTYTTTFKTNSNPGDFIITADAAAASDGFTLDTLSLVEVQSGDVVANGLFTGGGASGIKIDSSGNVGVGTTTPWGKFAVSGNTSDTDVTNPLFNIASSTATATSTLFTVLRNGDVGVGTSTPGSIFAIQNVVNFVTSATSSIYGALQTQNLVPAGPYTTNLAGYDLGATGARWNALWAGAINIGTSTFSLKSDGSSNLGIFTAASGGGTQAMTITSAGNVGIGTTTPSSYANYTTLTVEGPSAGGAEIDLKQNGALSGYIIANTANAGIALAAAGSNSLNLNTGGAQRLTILSTGLVGIGTTTPQAKLHVEGTVCLDINADFACTDNTAAISDARLKTNVTTITDGLSLVSQLRPVRFQWNGEYNTGTANSLGFLAQEVQTIFPNTDMVITDTNGYENLDYGKLTAVLASAVQVLDARTNFITSTSTTAFSIGQSGATSTNFYAGSGSITSLITTSATTNDLFSTNASIIYSTSTNSYSASAAAGVLSAASASLTNATSSSLYSAVGRFTTGVVDSLSSTLSSITNLTATNIVATNAVVGSLVTTNATSTNLFTTTLGAVTGSIGSLTTTDATTTNLAFQNAVGDIASIKSLIIGNATSTNIYASSLAADNGSIASLITTGATSTNLYSENANFGSVTAGTLSLSTAVSVGTTTLTNLAVMNTSTSTFAGPIESISGNLILATRNASSSIVFNPYGGNVGIGTSTPQHRLQVAGDIAAEAFVNSSTRELKTDITDLATTTEDSILEQLAGTNVYSYRYKDEPATNPLRVGLIVDSAPAEVLSVNNDGVDIYKLAVFTLAGVKAQERKIDAITMRLDDVETTLAQIKAAEAAASSGSGGLSLTALLDALKSLGTDIAENLAHFVKVVTDNFQVGSQEHPTGITMYDKSTGEPYCFQIDNGSATTTAGACTDIMPVDSSQSTDNSNTTPADSSVNGQLSTVNSVPTISINGNNLATISVGDTFGDLGAIITGPTEADKNLGIHVFVDGVEVPASESAQIDTSAAGEHTIDYVATNSFGTATSTRTVIVEAPANTVIDTTPLESVEPLTPVPEQSSLRGTAGQAATSTPATP